MKKSDSAKLIAQVHNINNFKKGIMPNSNQQWNSLCKALMKWANDSTSKDMRDFCFLNGYSYRSLRDWARDKKNEYFTECWFHAYEIIGRRREEKYFDHWDYIKTTMQWYNPDYNEHIFKTIEARKPDKEEVKAPQVIVVEVPMETAPLPKKIEIDD